MNVFVWLAILLFYCNHFTMTFGSREHAKYEPILTAFVMHKCLLSSVQFSDEAGCILKTGSRNTGIWHKSRKINLLFNGLLPYDMHRHVFAHCSNFSTPLTLRKVPLNSQNISVYYMSWKSLNNAYGCHITRVWYLSVSYLPPFPNTSTISYKEPRPLSTGKHHLMSLTLENNMSGKPIKRLQWFN